MTVVRLDRNTDNGIFVQMAEIHKKEISGGFLSTFHSDVLASIYRALSISDTSFVLVALKDDSVAGFIVGANSFKDVRDQIIRRGGIRCFVKIVQESLSVNRIKKLMESFKASSKSGSDGLPEETIFNFCVRSEIQGGGIGKALFHELCQTFLALGVRTIKIVTGEDQKSASLFYEKRGATFLKRESVHEGVVSRVYVYTIEPSP